MDLMTLALARAGSGGGAEVFSVEFTTTAGVTTSTKTFAQILEASNAGKIVIGICPYGSGAASSKKILLLTSIEQVSSNIGYCYFYNISGDLSARKVYCASIGGVDSWVIEDTSLQAQALTATVTIAVADWNGGTTVTKNVTGATATNTKICDISDPSVQCTGEGAGTLTFTAASTPTQSVTVKVVILP